MSLEKPFVLPTRALDDQDPVNFNMFTTFKKRSVPKIGNRASATSAVGVETDFSIVWEPSPNSQQGQSLVWRYPSERCRDKDFSELLDKISVPLGPNNS